MEIENKINRDYLIYKTGNKKSDRRYDFQMSRSIRSFGREIHNNDLSLDGALEQQIRLKDDVDILELSTKPKKLVHKRKKALTLKNVIILLNGK